MTGRRKGALEMHLDHGIPFVFGHVDQHAVAQDAGIQHKRVEFSEGGNRLVDHPLGAVPVRDVVAVGDRLAAHGLDLVHDLLSGTHIVAFSGPIAAQVVDHDLGAVLGQHQAVLAAHAPGPAGHDSHPSLAQSCHCPSRFWRVWPLFTGLI